jgi:hypothetical protein
VASEKAGLQKGKKRGKKKEQNINEIRYRSSENPLSSYQAMSQEPVCMNSLNK